MNLAIERLVAWRAEGSEHSWEVAAYYDGIRISLRDSIGRAECCLSHCQILDGKCDILLAEVESLIEPLRTSREGLQ